MFVYIIVIRKEDFVSNTRITPTPRKRTVRAIIALVIAGIYLINPTGGLIELVPDIVPLVGNLDEAAATALLLFGIRELRGDQNNVLLIKK